MRDIKINRNPIVLSLNFSVSIPRLVAALPPWAHCVSAACWAPRLWSRPSLFVFTVSALNPVARGTGTKGKPPLRGGFREKHRKWRLAAATEDE